MLRVDGAEVGLRSRRTRAVIAALALARGRTVTVDALCEAVWGEHQPQDPAAALHNQISRLRGLLGSAASSLETVPGGYRLSVDDQDVDVQVFEAAIVTARSGLNPSMRATALCEALETWRGSAYEDIDTDEARAEAARLAELRLAAEEDAAAALLEAGDVGAAVVALAALCTVDPLRERPRLLLAEALATDGRPSDALRTLDDYRRRLVTELGVDPSPAVTALEVDVLNGLPAARAGAQRRGAQRDVSVVRPPRVVVSVFGRDADRMGIVKILGTDRLVTVVGPGGVGKTTLALVVAESIETTYPHGAAYVDLSVAATEADVDAAFASSLGLERRAGVTATQRLVEALVGRRLLLVVDNVEHVVAAVALVVDAVLCNTDVDVIATGREPLKVRGERLWPVDPLPVGDADAPAVLLFRDRGRGVRPGWELADEERAACVEICRQLDGLPLAVELAAANMRTLSCRQLLARLHDPFQLLGGGRGTPARHRSLRAMIDWSYARLDEAERGVFDRIGVFAGSFGLSSATQICADLGLSGARVDQIMRELVDQSLVRADVGTERTRFSLFETLRLYARDRLIEAEQLDAVRDRHAAMFIDLAERVAANRWSRDEGYWTRLLDDERAELVAAQRWLLSQNEVRLALRLAVAAYLSMFDRGREDVVGLVDTVIDLAPERPDESTALWAMALGCAADRANTSGDLARGADLVARSRLFSSTGGPGTRFLCEGAAGDIALFNGRTDDAAAHYRAAAADARSAGLAAFGYSLDAISALPLAYSGARDEACGVARAALEAAIPTGCDSAIAMARYALAEALAGGDPDQARLLLSDAVAGAAAVGNVFVSGIATLSLATLAARTGDSAAALGHYRAVLDVWRRAGNWTQQWNTLRTLVMVLTETGRYDAAARLCGGIDAHATTPRWGEDEFRLEDVERRLSTQLGRPEFQAAVLAGGRLSAVEVIAFAEASIDAALTEAFPEGHR